MQEVEEQEIQESKFRKNNDIPIIEEQRVSLDERAKPNEFYRIAKEWRQLTIGFTNYIQNIVAFEKDSDTDKSYKVFLYFNNGRYQVWDIQDSENPKELTHGKELKITDNAKDFTVISSNEILYIDVQEKKLRVLNVENDQDQQFQNPFSQTVPTLAAMAQENRTDEKIENLLNDGTQLLYLRKNKLVILLEEKQQYMTSNESVITCWKLNQEGTQLWQYVFEEAEQRNLEITAMEDEDDTIIVWGPSYQDQNFKIRYKKANKPTEVDGLTEKIYENGNLNAQLVSGWKASDSQLIFWGNQNNSGIPISISIDLNGGFTKQELDVFEEEDKKYWILNDVPHFNSEKQLAIIGRSSQEGEFLDVYNHVSNKITFTNQVNNDYGIIKRSFSPDNRYFIEYEEATHGEDDEEQEMFLQITINTIVSIRTSICYFMEKSKVMEIFVPTDKKPTEKQLQDPKFRPDLQNEQFLQDVIACLTTGMDKPKVAV